MVTFKKVLKFLLELGLVTLLPYWDLRLGFVWFLVYRGRDNGERMGMLQSFLSKYATDQSKRCLQVGVPSDWNRKYGSNFVSIDLYDKRKCIDVRCDLARTPFNQNSFDFLICNAIMEHVIDPFACAKELYRIAKPGAEIWVEVPFIQSFHPVKNWSPGLGLFAGQEEDVYKGDENHGGDYWRFTPQGLVLLMQPFELKKMYMINEGGLAFYGVKPKKK